MVRAEGSDQVRLGGAADGGDLGAERLGQLDREGPHAAGGAEDQHLLTRLDAPVVAQALQRGQGGDGDRRGLLGGEVRRLVRELVARDARAYSANAPSPMPNTSSPGWNRVTSVPTAATTPATSRPRTGVLGARSP